MTRLIHFCAGLVLVAGLTGVCASAQSFREFIARIEASPVGRRMALVDSFMVAVPRFPLVENDTLCTLLWRGAASNVAVAGDHNGWNPASGGMSRLSTTDLWYRTQAFEADARVDYKFVIDGKNWIPDSLNPNVMPGGFGVNSELRMPRWRFPDEVTFNPAVPHGMLFDTTIASHILGNTRRIRIYVPAGISARGDSLGLILVHDGLDYINLGQMPTVLDNLIAAKTIKPVVAVFIPPVNRNAEYTDTQIGQFSSFIVLELLPFVMNRYRISSRPSEHATLGASAGGNISLWLGITHPEIFGGVAAQSSNVTDTVAWGYKYGPELNVRIYLDIGIYDIDVLLRRVGGLRSILDSRGFRYTYREVHEGHSWGNWRGHLGDALKFLFPPVSTEK